MTFQNEQEIAQAVLDGKPPVWKKCSRCGEDWSKLTPTGECPTCNPEHLTPKHKIEKPGANGDVSSQMGGGMSETKNENGIRIGCLKCRNSGTVPMMDWQGAVYSFACSCDAGKDLTSMARWNGQEWQLHRGKKYRLLEQYRRSI